MESQPILIDLIYSIAVWTLHNYFVFGVKRPLVWLPSAIDSTPKILEEEIKNVK